MRSYVRAWINAWDIRRLKPGTHWDEGGYDLQPLPSGYDEEPGLDEEGSGLVDGDGN
jgi:hypothetical protein